MAIINRSEAIKRNLNRYFTGKPCNHGHVSERFASNCACVQCNEEYQLKNKANISVYKSIWGQTNATRRSQTNAELYRNKQEFIKLRVRQYARDNPEKVREARRHRNAERCAARGASRLRATPPWSNKFFISEAYRLASLRTKLFGFKWEVDHLVPLRSNMVCGLHNEFNLAVITADENRRKGNRYWPQMPEATHHN